MKLFKTLGFLSLLISSTVTWAEETQCENEINISVNGLVCDFCARAIEKVFGKKDEVQGINVDLDNGLITVNLNEGQMLNDKTLVQLVTDSGYNVTNIQKGCTL